GVAAAAALVGAVLAGVSIAARLPERARRALNAVTYLRVMTSEVGIMLTSADPAHRSPDAVAELRRWYMRINAVIAAGADELHPDLLEFPPSPGTRPRRDLVG
ncbi:MAG TPA: hypothetical protein VI854_05390, partial [Acidimicrobiia bacterium]|nr:hypothetical protein [Acidimicrobiia bacterium]